MPGASGLASPFYPPTLRPSKPGYRNRSPTEQLTSVRLTIPADYRVIDTDSQNHSRRRIAIVLTCIFLAVLLHLLIHQYYPANIGREKWLAAFGFIAARNGFAGAAVAAMIDRAWLGFAIGVVVQPIVVVMLYGMPG